MDDFLSESITKKPNVMFEVKEWQKEILSKYHIKMC